MALDAILLSALVKELRPKLEGARIDKVQQPERDQVIISVRNNGENMKLLINAGAGSGRIQLTDAGFENPAEPPMFCMLLRKYLVSGRIEKLTQPDYERLLLVDITTHNELGDIISIRLAVELMGRSANLVLIGADGRIVDCLRRMDYGGDAERRMLPGMIYRLPPQQKKPLVFLLDSDARRKMLAAADRGKPLDKRLMDCFSGLSPLICRELAHRAFDDEELIGNALDAFTDMVAAEDFVPTLLTCDGKPKDFSFMSLHQYGGEYKEERFESFSRLLDAYYSKRERLERQHRRSKELSHSVKTNRDRIAKKLVLQREELKRTEGREEIRKNAELLTANMYRVKKGDRSLVCEDYYADGCPEIEVTLDVLKTPQKNAESMFKEYNKLKAAEIHLTKLIAEGEKQLDYLNSVLDEVERAESERDLAEIRRELTETGYIRKQKGAKPEKIKKQGPIQFVSSDGFEILVGRSNAQNDELTTKTARRTDYWLHTKNVHGSHVIISCDGLEPPEKTVEEAASLAVYYSQGREGGKTAVDYTMVRFVKKPAGSMPGKVIYTDYSTLMAEADEALAEKLKK
ncbi:MAG: NFACT RNA binding domain-containing protein [Bacillota bacterium]|nr:NFACT RNA binding domain-containing protein [Bacillota bacterium]